MNSDQRPPDSMQHLPLYARCALEYLEAQGERSIAKLNGYLEHYAKSCGSEIDEHVRFSAHAIAIRRFAHSGMDCTGSVARWYGDGSSAVCRRQPDVQSA
ncbi:MAG: hypothetical protein KGZ70_12900 [Hydrogenophaga sp.]|nr:hypothetical protein [Hydrogenophaga sp.]